MGLLQYAFIALLIASNAYAFTRGGWEGRWTALLLTFAAFSGPAVLHLGRPYADKSVLLLAMDFPLLLALGAIAFRTDRFWPLWLVALHLLSVCAEIATIIDKQVLARQYQAAQAFWSIPMQLLLALGVFLDRRAEHLASSVVHHDSPKSSRRTK